MTQIYWNGLKLIKRATALNSGGLRQLRTAGHLSAGLMLAAVLFASEAGAQKLYYRYFNAEGVMVQTDRLPPEVVRQGYQIVSANGDVLKVVPRELTAEERKLRDAENEKNQLALAELDRIRKWDHSLTLRYSHVDDIDEAKARSLKEFDIRIGILKGSLVSLKRQIETEQGDAANYARRGKDAPEALNLRIKSLKSEVLYAENAISELKRERIETDRQYQLDRERFEYLLEQAALRR